MRDMPRLHLDPAGIVFEAGASLMLPAEQAHYLGAVLRKQPGDAVSVFNGRGGEWHAVLDALRKDRASVRLERRTRAPAPEPGPTLVFAPLKRDATDLVVRAATELGVARLVPVRTERGVASHINPERWARIAAEAAEQCERLSVPAIDPVERLPELLGRWRADTPLLAALERPGPALPTPAGWNRGRAPEAPRPAVLIGPEGGFSPGERALLDARAFVVPVSLGRLVLRAETAAIAALAGLLD